MTKKLERMYLKFFVYTHMFLNNIAPKTVRANPIANCENNDARIKWLLKIILQQNKVS